MRSRILTATPAMIAGAVVACAAQAATPAAVMITAAPWTAVQPAARNSLGEIRPTDYQLGGMTILPSDVSDAQSPADTLLGPANTAPQAPPMAMARGAWTPPASSAAFAASATAQNPGFLAGGSTFSATKFALSRDVALEFSHANLDLAGFGATPPGTNASDLAQRLGTGVQLMGTTSASLNWNFSDWAGLALTATHAGGNGALLGSIVTPGGATGLAESATLGISARIGFGEGWVTTVAYNEGVTQLDLNHAPFNTTLDRVRSSAYALGVAKQGLFGDDALGIAVSRPLQIFGAANLTSVPALSQARESDVELGYVTTFLDGSLALQANAAYQLNAAGAKGQNAVTGVARAKLNF